MIKVDAARGRGAHLARFVSVGASGLIVNQLALWGFADGIGLHYLTAAILATQCSTLWNFAWTERWVFRVGSRGRFGRLLWFATLNNAWLIARGPVLVLLIDGLGLGYLVANFVTLVSVTLIRYAVSERLIWSKATARETVSASGRVQPFYDIHGIVTVASDVGLPELEFFASPRPADAHPDVIVKVTSDGFGGIGLRPRIEQRDDQVIYAEHLGRFGFACRIEHGSTTTVHVSRTVGRSPHVLYTNVVEPLLRWSFVEKGYALVHAACLEVEGRGALITAHTDTGKTTTCLMSVKSYGAGFVADDLIIIDGSKTAYTFPKPLTISAHTLHAAQSAPLRLGRRLWLQVQSRFHSKGGRRVGFAVSRLNLPVCTLNAWFQRVVPPPKFDIAALIPDARIVRSVRIEHMGVIERGPTLVQPLLDLDENVRVLRENTEDAFGFPPYPLIAAMLPGRDEEREEALRYRLLDGLPVTHIRTADRHWYEQLLLLITEAPFAPHHALLQRGGSPSRVRHVVATPDGASDDPAIAPLAGEVP